MSKRRGRQTTTEVDIGGRPVKVLDFNDSAKYLGRKLSFDYYHATELNNRKTIAWRKFNALRDEITKKKYPLPSRIKLFNMTITPKILYGCPSWTTTQDHTTTLLRTQRRMLRLIIGTPRWVIAQPQHESTDHHPRQTHSAHRRRVLVQ